MGAGAADTAAERESLRPHYLDFILICGPLAEYYLRKC